jgi:hypothetical protein
MRTWDIADGVESGRLLGGFGGASISPAGLRIVSTSSSHSSVTIWDASRLQQLAEFALEGRCGQPCVSDDGRLLVIDGFGTLFYLRLRNA